MQAKYPNKPQATFWDTLRVGYPVRQFVETGTSSEHTARRTRGEPEVIKGFRRPCLEEVEYDRDYNITKELLQSHSAVEHGYKESERFRRNKHTSCQENAYVYPSSRKFSERIPSSTVHGGTEMQSAYEVPSSLSRLVTDKDQWKHPAFLPHAPLRWHAGKTVSERQHTIYAYFQFASDRLPAKVTTYHKELEPLDTTYEGFEKYLDPYLTTSRLHHRPYTAHELSKASNSRDIMTYYTYADIPWVRVPRPKTNEWGLPISRPKSMYDREKFKEDFREIRTHNKLRWVPGSFRTEIKDNYVQPTARPEAQIHNSEEEVRTLYQRAAGQLFTNVLQENLATLRSYSTENSIIGSRKPICTVFDPYVEKNKRLAGKSF